jgi:uncharacterized protein (DUF1501 family)
MKEMTLHTRREFLRRAALGSALSWTVPAFLANTFAQLHAESARPVQARTGRDSTILVILQMAGGNDGLNTVVPCANDHYFRARPKLGLIQSKILKLNDELGLHQSLAPFKALYDSGNLAIIQGVGYPNPNRSHFRSTEIWQTASDSKRFERYGWIGRYFDSACQGADPAIGVSIGSQMPQSFQARNPKGIAFDNPQNYRFKASAEIELPYRKLNDIEDELAQNSGATVGMLPGATRPAGSALDFLERTALDVQISSDTIRDITSKAENKATYPLSQLGNSLKLVARLIAGGMSTRVYYVSQGGYDTHANQSPTQARLLSDLGDSTKAFVDDLKAQDNLSRVLVMTFSEFGRRVAENANGGTDHGAAAPLFILGDKMKAGLLGQYPSLAPADLFQGDLRHTVDFRSVYATLLENWLKTPSRPILGDDFEKLPLV